jgi:IMP dehydrogenase
MLTTSANPKAGFDEAGISFPPHKGAFISAVEPAHRAPVGGAGAELAMAAKSKEPPREALTFDDVLLKPGLSDTLPSEVDIRSRITRTITLNVPIIASAMDTVTEAQMAIAMAQGGGLGVLHRNMDPEQQAAQVRQVKKFESGMVVNPVTIHPEATLADALALMKDNRISGIPVVERGTNGAPGKLLGILTNRDVRFATDPRQKISELMTRDGLITVREGVGQDEAKRLLHQHRIEKLLVVDAQYRCVGLITVKDIEKAVANPNACKDDQGRLRVAAATTVGDKGFERTERLIEAGVDLVVVDTAHGHSKHVLAAVERIKRQSNAVQVVAGNIATGEGAKALIDSGADAIKVGIGPGSICTTRIVAGVGVPQLTAVMDAVEAARASNTPVIADGGIKYSGDLAKALAAGADCAMIGSLLAGTDETPGEVFLYQGRSYKTYRGMGSVSAMSRGSADRYFQQDIKDSLKLVPEGVEGQVPYKGAASTVLHQLAGGLRAAMGYVGAKNLEELHQKAEFVRISTAGLRESHVHDVTITRESPNYPGRG